MKYGSKRINHTAPKRFCLLLLSSSLHILPQEHNTRLNLTNFQTSWRRRRDDSFSHPEKNTNLEIRRGCCAIHAMPQLLLPSNPEILQRIDRSSDLGRVSSRAPQLTLPTPWCNDDKEHGEQTAKEPTVNGPECFIVPGKETLDGSDLPRQRLITQGRRNLIHDRNNLIRLDDTTLSSTNTIIQEYKFRQYEKCTSNVLEPCL